MTEAERAIVRACLEQVVLGLVEAREVRTWWMTLSEQYRQEYRDFTALVMFLRHQLDVKREVIHL